MTNLFKPHHKIAQLILFALSLGFLLLPIQNTKAHQLPNGVNHNTFLTQSSSQNILLNYDLSLFYTDLENYWNSIDTNQNRIIETNEKESWLGFLKDYLYFEFNTQNYPALGVTEFSQYEQIKDSIYPTIKFTLDFGQIALAQELQDFRLINKFRIVTQDPQDWNFSYDPNTLYLENLNFEDQQNLNGQWKSLTQAQSNNSSNPSLNSISYEGARNYLDQALRSDSFSLAAILFLVFAAFIFGCAHTLTPGHGKSVIGAYMIAIKGNWKDALVMALSTTLSHTSIVILLGFMFIWLRNGLSLVIPLINLPINIPSLNLREFLPYLNIISGTAIILIGLWIFWSRLQEYINTQIHKRAHEHAHAHGLDHDHIHTHHDHAHHHDHTHRPFSHSHTIPDHRLSLKEAISLGFSTGLSPCIDAIAILILAINLDKTWLGIAIILIFSIGMATTLVAIGWSVGAGIKGSRRLKGSEKFLEVLPMISAILIAITGLLLLLS